MTRMLKHQRIREFNTRSKVYSSMKFIPKCLRKHLQEGEKGFKSPLECKEYNSTIIKLSQVIQFKPLLHQHLTFCVNQTTEDAICSVNMQCCSSYIGILECCRMYVNYSTANVKMVRKTSRKKPSYPVVQALPRECSRYLLNTISCITHNERVLLSESMSQDQKKTVF